MSKSSPPMLSIAAGVLKCGDKVGFINISVKIPPARPAPPCFGQDLVLPQPNRDKKSVRFLF